MVWVDEEAIIRRYRQGEKIRSLAEAVKTAYDEENVSNGIREKMSLKEARAVVEKIVLEYLQSQAKQQQLCQRQQKPPSKGMER